MILLLQFIFQLALSESPFYSHYIEWFSLETTQGVLYDDNEMEGSGASWPNKNRTVRVVVNLEIRHHHHLVKLRSVFFSSCCSYRVSGLGNQKPVPAHLRNNNELMQLMGSKYWLGTWVRFSGPHCLSGLPSTCVYVTATEDLFVLTFPMQNVSCSGFPSYSIGFFPNSQIRKALNQLTKFTSKWDRWFYQRTLRNLSRFTVKVTT